MYVRRIYVSIVFTIEETVPVTGVTLSQTEAAMTVGGDIFTLAGKLIPSNDSTEGQVHRAKAVC